MKKRFLVLTITVIMLLAAVPVQAQIVTPEGRLPFEDTQSGWYLSSVGFCYANGIMSGKSDTVFDPKGETTREQMMTVLAKLDGDEGVYSQCTFEDVNENSWYAPYVNMAVAKGYTSGISETLFGIGKTLTRQETVTLMYNFAVANDYETANDGDLGVFGDTADVADWALDAFGWAVGKGIIAGSNGKLNPCNSITRAELAQIIRTFTENILYGNCEHIYRGNGCTEILTCSQCGMKKGWPTGHICSILNCDTGSECENCGVLVVPDGHKYTAADCTKPMTCSVCSKTIGAALGHTTECGICARCGIEIFESKYDKFVYYMEQKGMTDPTWLGCKFLMANVTYPDGGKATQYVKYNDGRTVFEIIYNFPGNDHQVKTTITMDFEPGSAYHVESYYSENADLLHADYYGSGTIKAADSSFTLAGYSGDSAYKKQFDAVVKGTLLLNLDASNTLIKKFIGLSMADFGFTAFN